MPHESRFERQNSIAKTQAPPLHFFLPKSAKDESEFVSNVVMYLPRILTWPLSMLLVTLLLMKTMPTSFPKALLVSLIATGIGMLLTGLFGVIAMVLGMVLR